jgi:hypothetical protein
MPTTPLQISYVDPDGTEWNLTDYSASDGFVCSGITGIEGLPVAMQTIPLLDGSAYPNYYIQQPGAISMAVLLCWPSNGNENTYYDLLDRFVRAFYTRRNEVPTPGYIVVQRPNGTKRQVQVYTTSGLNTPEVGIHGTVYSLTLDTPDPAWYDQQANQLLFVVPNSPGILPLLPVQLSSSYIIGDSNIYINSGASCYPQWTLSGPGTPTMTNHTTGRSWSLNTSIPAGHIVQVVTKPGQQSVVDVTSSNSMWDNLVLSGARDLWTLVPGLNQITVAMAGATLATTVGLTWRNRWFRA